MKTLVKIDFYGQASIIVLSILLAFAYRLGFFAGIYFGLGAWQLVFCLLYLLSGKSKSTARKVYEILLLGTLLFVSLAFFDHGSVYAVLFGMLFIGPVMSLFNFAIVLRDFNALGKKHGVWDID